MKPGRGIALSLFSVALLGLCAEAGLRVLEQHWRYRAKRSAPDYMQPNPYLASTLKPGERFEMPGDVVVEVNALGFRGPEIEARKRAGTYRIVALGGSTTFGHHSGIHRTEQTYPFKLERELRERLPGRDIEVINAGVPGYTLRNSLLNYVARVNWLEPDLLIVYHGVNDASSFRSEGDLVTSVSHAKIDSVHPVGRLERLLSRSYLLLDLSYRLRKLNQRYHKPVQPVAISKADAPEETSRNVPRHSTLAAYERNLRNLIVVAQANGTDVAVVRQAVMSATSCDNEVSQTDPPALEFRGAVCGPMTHYFPHLSGHGLSRTLDGFAETQQALADEFDLVWIDADAAIPDSLEHHSDMCHLHPAGTTLLARAISAGIAPRIESASGNAVAVQRTTERTDTAFAGF